MVVFTCNNCGESLQKPRVEKHYQTACRSAVNLTCVDCMKDFRGDEYVTHIKCMTEDERYAARGSMTIGLAKKGEAKQQTWTDMIRSIIEKEENLSKPIQNMLQTVSGYVNIPRKKQKFINFVSNSFGYSYNKAHVEMVWDLIEKHKAEQFPAKNIELKKADETNGTKTKETNGSINGNGETIKRKADSTEKQESDGEVPTKKKKKSKKISVNGENSDTNTQESGVNGNAENGKQTEDADDKFSFEDKIMEILTAKKQMSLKKLQKKVLNAYIKHQQVEQYSEKQVKKFTKRLNKLPNIEVTDDLVTLTKP